MRKKDEGEKEERRKGRKGRKRKRTGSAEINTSSVNSGGPCADCGVLLAVTHCVPRCKFVHSENYEHRSDNSEIRSHSCKGKGRVEREDTPTRERSDMAQIMFESP